MAENETYYCKNCKQWVEEEDFNIGAMMCVYCLSRNCADCQTKDN